MQFERFFSGKSSKWDMKISHKAPFDAGAAQVTLSRVKPKVIMGLSSAETF